MKTIKSIPKHYLIVVAILLVAMVLGYTSVKSYTASRNKPVISIDGENMLEVEKDTKVKLPKVTAKDKKDGNITKRIRVKVTSSDVSKSKCRRIAKLIKKNKKITFSNTGNYTVIYSVRNSIGKSSQKKLKITVTEPKKRYWIMTQHPDDSGNQGMFYTFYNEYANSLVVIDGGHTENATRVRNVINSYGGHVDAWILTHYHPDHVCAFNAIMKEPEGITVDNIYASPMDYDEYLEIAKWWDEPYAFTDFLDVTADRDVTYMRKGEGFEVEDLRFTVYNSYDSGIASYGDIPNNASLLFKVTGAEDSILFCGDCYVAKLGDDLIERWGDELKAEYVQTGHHGNNSFPSSFYDVVSPKTALFDAPEWLMVGEEYTAKDLKEYFSGQGVQVYDLTTAPNEFEFR